MKPTSRVEDTKLQSIQLGESKPSWYSPLLPVSWMLTPSWHLMQFFSESLDKILLFFFFLNSWTLDPMTIALILSQIISFPLSGLPWCLRWQICLRCRRRGFHPWAGKDPLEKGLATHSGILTWRIWLTEEPGGLLSGCKESDTTEHACIKRKHKSSRWNFWVWDRHEKPVHCRRIVAAAHHD